MVKKIIDGDWNFIAKCIAKSMRKNKSGGYWEIEPVSLMQNLAEKAGDDRDKCQFIAEVNKQIQKKTHNL